MSPTVFVVDILYFGSDLTTPVWSDSSTFLDPSGQLTEIG